MFKKVISLALSIVFSLQTCGFAQAAQFNLAGYLGQAGSATALDRFRPASLRYFSYEPNSDNFQILLDKADEKGLNDIQVKDKADELMKYFRIGLSLPNDKFWVNLRPDAPEQIIDPALERTDIGKIMLEADLQLKKDTSSLTSPQTKEGKEYWDKLYKKAGELFGTENITIPTITRPWIVPGEIIVRQSGNSGSTSLATSVYIYKAALKVMLEQDHLKGSLTYDFKDPRMKELNEYSSQLIRELIIPQLTKEVNRSRRYAGLRQVYYSLILARWFKQGYQNSEAPVNENNTLTKLIDSGSLTNLTSQEPWSKDTYYQGYKNSFEQGEYNLSETVRTPTGQLIRRYVSGGISAGSALKVNDHFDVGKITKGIPVVGDNSAFFNYASNGSKPVVINAASRANSEQRKDDPLITAIRNIPKKLSKLTAMSDISLSASARMEAKDAGVSLMIIYSDKASVLMLEDICNRISEYKGYNSWRIEFKKGSTIEQIEKKLLGEAGITVSSALDLRLSLISRANALLESLGIKNILPIKDDTDLLTLKKLIDEETKKFDENFTLADKIKSDLRRTKWRQGMEYLEGFSKTVSMAIIAKEMDKISRKLKKTVSIVMIEIYRGELQGLSEKLAEKIGELKQHIAAGSPISEELEKLLIELGQNIKEIDDLSIRAFNLKGMLAPENQSINLMIEGLGKLRADLRGIIEKMRIELSLSAITPEETPGTASPEVNKLTEGQISLLETLLPANKKLSQDAIDIINRFLSCPVLYPAYLNGLENKMYFSIGRDDLISDGYADVYITQNVEGSHSKREIYFLALSRDLLISALLFKAYPKAVWNKKTIKEVKDTLHSSYDFDEDLRQRIKSELNLDGIDGTEIASIIKDGGMLKRIDSLIAGKVEEVLKDYNNEPSYASLGYPVRRLRIMGIEEEENVLYAVLFAYQIAYRETIKIEKEIQLKDPNYRVNNYEVVSELAPLIAEYLLGITDYSATVVSVRLLTIVAPNLTDEDFYRYSITRDHAKNLLELAKNKYEQVSSALTYEDRSSSTIITSAVSTIPKFPGGIDFRQMDTLIQPMGSFSGLDFSPVALNGQALEAMDLERDLEGINQMTLGRRRPHPQRLKEYVSACIFKGKIDEKADDFIFSMLEVFQLQAEEGIESAAQDREAVVLADTRRYVLPEKKLAASNSYSLN